MKKTIKILLIALWIINAFFIAYMLAEGSKYPLNLLDNKQAYLKLTQIRGVGEVKADKIIVHRAEITNIKQIDTDAIKYSKYFTMRSWDMRTDVMYIMFAVALLIMLAGVVWLLVMLYRNGIKVVVNKYVVLDPPKDSKQ